MMLRGREVWCGGTLTVGGAVLALAAVTVAAGAAVAVASPLAVVVVPGTADPIGATFPIREPRECSCTGSDSCKNVQSSARDAPRSFACDERAIRMSGHMRADVAL
jgi:hypothetical protein